MTGKWDHSTKPSKFVVIDNGKEIYRGGFIEGCRFIKEKKNNLLKQVILERDEAQNEIIGWKNKWECAVEMAARAEIERDEAREALREMWQSGDAFLPHVDSETINRWRKAAGWDGTK